MIGFQSRKSGYAGLVVSFDQVLSTETTNEILSSHARLLLDRLSERGWLSAGEHIAHCITGGNVPDLCNYDPDVRDLEACDQYLIGQCLAYFRKRQDIDLGVDRKAAAVAKFSDAESACKITNSCFRAWEQGRFQFRPAVERVLHAAQQKISSVLGQAPSLDELRPRFGPGATTQVQKRDACSFTKLTRIPACSANFGPTAEILAQALSQVVEVPAKVLPPDCWDFYPSFEKEFDVEIHAAQLSFVPKNAKIDRAICTEPSLNGMYQLALGDVMADRLKTIGIDITDQSANQRAAWRGSISGSLATIDLSSASDTVATGLVQHLFQFCPDWLSLIEGFRTAEYRLDKGPATYLEKISSMGNGFTFPLETLIFWAIAQSVTDYLAPKSFRVLVYGDDIIVPNRCAVELIAVLRDLGFTPNPTKSFWTGSFRESCGCDYVSGTSVRPVFVDDSLAGSDFFRLHNFFVERGDYQSAMFFEGFLHPSVITRGPKGYGDGHLHAQAWVARRTSPHKGWSGYTFETWAHKPKALRKDLVDRLRKGKDFTSRSYAVVKRVALYESYRREASDLYGERSMPVPRPGGRDPLVVPGLGMLCRTKVYTFEPPHLH